MSFNILNVGEHAFADNTITSFLLHDHCPYANTTLNKSDQIIIPIETQNIYTLPSQSYLYLEGRLTNAENKESSTLFFINNGLLFLFDEIRFELGGNVIDRIRNPGVAATLKGYASFTDNESKRYINACWDATANPDISTSKGYFSACIPLKNILGFCEDFKKILVNTKSELILIRSASDINSVTSINADEKPLVTLTKVIWKVPHIQVADVEKLRLLNYIEKGRDLELAFRSWELHEYPVLQETQRHTWNIKVTNQLEKPRFIIFGFQVNRRNIIGKNAAHFDHCNLTNIKLYLNSEVYPYQNLNLNFENYQFAMLYEMYAKFQESYYYKNVGQPCLNLMKFLSLAPITVIDCSHQNESLKSGGVDVRLEFETSQNIPPQTAAFCLIIHDRQVKYNPLTNVVRSF